ncbi:MAG: tetratricopeptide repeat protein [Campylobacterota bacterium]|nr:tetratricopeptide repeat protein [Campylobacterota bacterium]
MSIIKKYQYALKLHEKEEYKKAYDYFLELANSNDANSQEMVANMLYHGSGVKEDKECALDWYEKAAINGNIEAQYWYGRKKLEQDHIDEGIFWIKKSANNNYSDALRSLGLYYLDEKYFNKNVNKAIILLKKAFFEYGNKEAFPDLLYALGIKYNKWKVLSIIIKNTFEMFLKKLK